MKFTEKISAAPPAKFTQLTVFDITQNVTNLSTSRQTAFSVLPQKFRNRIM